MITPLPNPPSRSSSPDTFAEDADAFMAALPVFATEVNASAAAFDVTKWITGTTYALGDRVWSPADFQTYRRKVAGAGATDPSADSTNWELLLFNQARLPRGYMAGYTYANNVSDATNDIDVAAGSARDSTNAADVELAAAITKRLDATWAVGTNQGGLDTGSIGNSDYYIHAIKRPDTGVVDVLFSLSATAPTMPANYTYRRLIGWFKRVGGTIVAFHTYEIEGGGLEFMWDAPTMDIDLAATLTTTRRTDPVKVPLNFSVRALLNIHMDDTSGVVGNVCCPDQTDAAPSTSAAPLSTINVAAGVNGAAQQWVRTSAAGLVAARATVATIDLYRVVTVGFCWGRRA